MGRTVIYCNRTVKTYLELQAMNKTNVLLNSPSSTVGPSPPSAASPFVLWTPSSTPKPAVV
jgi:hypothetical protein